jgi:hypothetical protein
MMEDRIKKLVCFPLTLQLSFKLFILFRIHKKAREMADVFNNFTNSGKTERGKVFENLGESSFDKR